MGWWGETRVECVGRFCLDLPRGMTRAGGYSMRGVGIEEVPRVEPRAGAFERAWAAKLADIDQARTARPGPGSVAGTIVERRIIRPGGFDAVYWLPRVEPEGRWTALVDAGAVVLSLEGTGHRRRGPTLLSSITAIAEAYRTRSPGDPWPLPGKDAFYLDAGAVMLPFDELERATVTFEGLDQHLHVETCVVRDPEGKGLFDRFMENVMPHASEMPDPLVPARHRRRTVAGLAGEELWIRSDAGRKLFLLWSYPGEAGSGPRPEFEIEMRNVREEDEKKAGELWDALLDSMRPAR